MGSNPILSAIHALRAYEFSFSTINGLKKRSGMDHRIKSDDDGRPSMQRPMAGTNTENCRKTSPSVISGFDPMIHSERLLINQHIDLISFS
ncbi:hypothetical protein [Paramesorhizobium deserti]|uniref:hypothetical protein n=1 Tax=Paramesorhizobium deserti TaxID=1494590 RepID=UPI00129014B6|nr:hypothetical protein [Paramesorhizobium deserti]